MCQNGQGELPRAMGSTRMRTDRVLRTARPSPAASRPGSASSAVKVIAPDWLSWKRIVRWILLIRALGAIGGWSLRDRRIASGRDAHRRPTPAATMCYPVTCLNDTQLT